MNIEKHIEILNNLIYESVEHGGDAGGAYYSNTENVLKAINEYLKVNKYEWSVKADYKNCCIDVV